MNKMKLATDSLTEKNLLKKLMDGTATETGQSFFRALVKNLAQALGTHGAWVTEYLPDKKHLRAMAFWLGSSYVDHYEYDIAGTPCEPTIKKRTLQHIPDNVVKLFPADPDLPKVGAVSYMGFPLLDPENNILGNLAVLDTQPMPESFRNQAVFRIFAARATAELLRIHAEADIRAREEKLNGIFNGAMDAILEMDHEFNIIMINPAAEKFFSCHRDHVLGQSFMQFIAPEDSLRFKNIVRSLKSYPRNKRNIWVPQGLVALTTDKRKIAAEATLSRISVASTPCYVLILRDVNERYEARRKIESLRGEAAYLKDEIRSLTNLGDIIGESRPFQETLNLVADVSPTDSTVLIYGETGTGKELIARAIHAASLRKDRPLIIVNCAAIPDSLIESEFFGHEKGAFTGASQHRQGRFALANKGTIFLDEIGELNRDLQAKLLRVLQEGEFSPVGSSRVLKTDVRVIAATNRNLSQAVQSGNFRADLYYRLNVFPINIPPLRERGDDIRLLAEHAVQKFSTRMAIKIDPLSIECVERLKAYNWPGNVRELQNIIERGVITAQGGRLNLERSLPDNISRSSSDTSALPSGNDGRSIMTIQQILRFERENLLLALEKTNWRVAGNNGAAKLLGIPPSTLQSKMKSLGIKRPH
jgi:PAS domain S-box-containing protein